MLQADGMAEPYASQASPAAQQARKKPAHVLFCIAPCMGHINAPLELIKRIAGQGNIVTIVTSELQISKLQSGGKDMETGRRFGGLDIRLVGIWDGYKVDERPPPSWGTTWKVIQRMDAETEPYLESLVGLTGDKGATVAYGPPLTCIMTDRFLSYTQNVADRLKIPRYVCFSNSAFYMAVMWYLPQLVSQGLLQLGPPNPQNTQQILRMPGFPDLPYDKFPKSAQERADTLLSCGACLPGARGILINTYDGIEGDGIMALQAEKSGVLGLTRHQKMPLLLPVGPVFSSTLVSGQLSPQETASCMQFLDSKPTGSVLYVAFGSETPISRAQILELAMGLEASGQPFLWVVRVPPPVSASSKLASGNEIDSMLPTGFRERIADRGLVVCNWAPQLLVLQHASTGAFFSHCGWNSVLESIHVGVPILAFPMGADHHMNCRFFVDKLKVGFELIRKTDPEGEGLEIASKEEIERAVRRMMIGDESLCFRARVGELRQLSSAAASSAHENLGVFLEQITTLVS